MELLLSSYKTGQLIIKFFKPALFMFQRPYILTVHLEKDWFNKDSTTFSHLVRKIL